MKLNVLTLALAATADKNCELYTFRARRDGGMRIFLKIIRRQPVFLGDDKCFKKIPRPARKFVELENLFL